MAGGVQIEDDARRWVMWGEIDFSVAHAVKERLAATVAHGPWTIDLSRVTFMDSGGLHLVLLGARRGHRPRLLRTPEHVLQLLEFSGALDLVELVETAPEAPHPEPPHERSAG
ncbi:STAS domain-containing protein [Cellulosimicrobium protaetiae]|uniref:STAS domain-containing protein n=1 Tax=Cellulosimicrobium protaetiae TaxID=2587808 RepID=A0A6M5UA42_9MICO|nr:STAS domain-containing protein [Cellulosimicrobium protaetiae]QJW34984.1 STAS domain-containing protein [Cellulosimicrobium protaetiae]